MQSVSIGSIFSTYSGSRAKHLGRAVQAFVCKAMTIDYYKYSCPDDIFPILESVCNEAMILNENTLMACLGSTETRDPASLASIKVTYSLAPHCPYNVVFGNGMSLIPSCLTPRCNMQCPNGKSILEILAS